MANENAIQVSQPQPSRLERTETFAPRNLAEAFQFADMVLVSGMAPKSYLEIYSKAIEGGATKEDAGIKARSAIVVALQLGLEVGFQPMQALQNIASINGTPSVWGDGALALVRSSGLLECIKEDNFDTIKKNQAATCVVKRKGDPEEKVITFTYEDAKKAGIFERGVWKNYPYRMCMFRARGFALRDKFADILKGLKIAEEVLDYIDPEPQPEQPKIQASVVVPQTQLSRAVANTDIPKGTAVSAEESKPAEVEKQADPVEEEKPATITIPEAKLFYAAYSKSGYLPEESKAWLKEKLNITDSRLIKPEDYKTCMDWANTAKPKPAPTEENMDAEPVEEWTGTLPQE